MGFYDLNKEERANFVIQIQNELQEDILQNSLNHFILYFSDEDTYIRKSAYIVVGRLFNNMIAHRQLILQILNQLFQFQDPKIRQTVINAAGEIGMQHFEIVQNYFDTGLFDAHHSVRNAVIGSIKKMGQKNPAPVIEWSKKYLQHPDKEIRREICHGIELRGRTHPEDILPLLETLQYDKTKRVRWTLVHVIGQIAYKKGCLEKVCQTIKNWDNQDLVQDAYLEIIDVHNRYRNFSSYTQKQAIDYLKKEGLIK